MHTPNHAPINIPAHRVGANQVFHFDIQPFIKSTEEHPIRLIAPQLPWFKITPKGLVSGTSPNTKVLLQFWITLEIGLHESVIRTGFLLQIVPLLTSTMVIPRIPVPLLHPVDPSLPHTHDLLDYLFLYFMTFEKDNWLQLLRDEASKRGNVFDESINLYAFKELITTMNPLAERQLRESSNTLQVLTLAELNADQFTNLFRQGSQPMGSTPIVVFNYLAAPDRHNYSHVKNILDLAADEIIDLIEQNQLAENLQVHPQMKKV